MVEKLSIGIVGIQGAISEHISILKKAFLESDISGNVFVIKNPDDIKKIDALILPGGESTTISKILYKKGLHQVISKNIAENNFPVMGTCAGCVLLSSGISDKVNDDIKILNAIDIQVERNAFGRQKASFEKNISIKGFNKPYNAVFIRAPVIKKAWGNVEILGKINNKIVMVRQDKILALSFHPELTNDIRIHKFFIDMV